MDTKIELENGKVFIPGAFPDRDDNRDFKFEELVGGVMAPFDWKRGYLNLFAEAISKVKNQGSSGSCGGQAGSYYSGVKEAEGVSIYEDKSAKFIYAQKYVPGGGMYLRDIFDVLINQGDCDSALLPDGTTEDFMRRGRDINDAMRKQAKFSRASAYGIVNTDIDSVAKAVATSGGLILLIAGSNNGTWGSAYPTAPKSGESMWYHFVLVVGAVLKNEKKYIKIINSWGNVGENGRQYLGEEFFPNYVLGARTMVQIKDKVGWCADKYLKNGITTGNLHLRDVAGLSGKIITKIPKNTQIDLLGLQGKKVDGYNWVKVQVI